ncbi:endonuclease III [Candidatus Aenigmatarchaeota archaeon]
MSVLSILEKEYGSGGTMLKHHNVLELMIATMLAAQCTDKRVNIVTKSLFKRYRKASDYSFATLSGLEKEIKSTGFYKNKAKNIKNACKMIVEKYNGKVPKTMDELIKLPGIGRKTANIILTYGFGKTEGIAVDTHVRRLSFRLGLTDKKDPDKIEQDLIRLFSKKDWYKVNYLLVTHGRAICKAPSPTCSVCVLSKKCPRNGVVRSK